MTEVTKEIIYNGLRALQSDISSVRSEFHDIKLRMISVDQSLSGICRRFDRVDIRLERLEHHLNFVSHPLP
jgi:hypothetical protein